MKLEIEITEDEIKSAIERKVRVAIADKTNEWRAEGYIKAHVDALWPKTVDKMIEEYLQELPTLKLKIVEQVDKKLKAQVTALMKVGK